MINMTECLTIRNTEKGWQLETYSGNYPITFKLIGNGWSIPAIWSDGPARLSYELVFEAYDVKYIVNVYAGERTIEYVTVDEKEVDVIKLGSGHPVTTFMFKTIDGIEYPINELVTRS